MSTGAIKAALFIVGLSMIVAGFWFIVTWATGLTGFIKSTGLMNASFCAQWSFWMPLLLEKYTCANYDGPLTIIMILAAAGTLSILFASFLHSRGSWAPVT